MGKSFYVVSMTLSPIFFFLQYYFGHTFTYIFQTLEIIFNIVLYENPRQKLFCCIYQNL